MDDEVGNVRDMEVDRVVGREGEELLVVWVVDMVEEVGEVVWEE